MYADHETRISRAYLERVLRVVEDPVWIIGGWAVWFSVREAFHRATGREYAFSRDIDLGFHIDPAWTGEQLAESSFARTARVLIKDLDFKGQGFRLYREFHTETGNPLTPAEAARLPSHFVFPLYVDLMVDHQHPRSREVPGFTPADEPHLARIAQHGGTPLPEVSAKLTLPGDGDLLAMKVAALPNREREHKRVKDMADIFALLAYGRARTGDLLAEVRGGAAATKARQFVANAPGTEIAAAAAVAATTPASCSRCSCGWACDGPGRCGGVSATAPVQIASR